MDGILTEFDLFMELMPGRPTFPVGYPGGEARRLALESPSALGQRLVHQSVYPALARAIIHQLASQPRDA